MTDVRERNEAAWSSVARWSMAPVMTDAEAVMWRAERHPWLSSTIVAVELLDEAPDWDRLRDAHRWGSELVGRFRQRVIDRPALLGPPRWAEDPCFDLDYHLRRSALPGGAGGLEDLLQLVQQLALTPLDRARPLWEATLVEGLDDGRCAYVLKSHHSLSDGVAGIQLFGGMHSRTREPSPRKPRPKRPSPTASAETGEVTRGLAGLARAVPDLVRRGAPIAVEAALRPAGLAAETARLAGSVRRVVTTPGATPSALLADRTGRGWRFAALEVPLPALKAAGKVAGASVTEAYLVALLGGLERWHARRGATAGTIPVAVPVSLRSSGDEAGGNRFTAATIPGPAGLADPVERLHAVRGALLTARAEPALPLTDHAAPVLSRLPGRAVLRLRGAAGAAADLAASSFPGIREEVFLAGARVERLWAFGPLPGAAVMATLVSHGETCCVSLNCDASVIPDATELAADVQAGFDEVLALAKARS